MHARVTQLEIDTVRIDVAAAIELFRSEVLPELSRRPGYQGVQVLATPDGQGVIVSYWDTEEQADTGQTPYAETLERYVTLFKAPPGRGCYSVMLTDPPTAPG